MSYEIRTALPADRDGIYGVEQLCSGMPWSKGQIAEELENACSYTVVAEEAGEIIGFASAHILQGDAHLNELGVLPAHRRRGIARALLGDVLREAGYQRCGLFSLEVRESNEAAIALYSAFGLVPAGVRKNFYRNPAEHALVMIKTIEEEK